MGGRAGRRRSVVAALVAGPPVRDLRVRWAGSLRILPDRSIVSGVVEKQETDAEPQRKPIPSGIRREVLAEAGYICGNPNCRTILAMDLHHLVPVADGGANDPANLLALCPNCHALYERGTIHGDALYNWKGILVALNGAFDREAISLLLFLDKMPAYQATNDGILRFAGLIAADIVAAYWPGGELFKPRFYDVTLTHRGRLLVAAWKSGNRVEVREALAGNIVAP